MGYYFSKIISTSFDKAIELTTEALKNEGFGVLTDIDVKATMKKKLNIDFRNYRILGACSPTHAYRALLSEDKIGTMLPCSVIVQELEDNKIEIASVDPIASMSAIQNPNLADVAIEVQNKLKTVIENIK